LRIEVFLSIFPEKPQGSAGAGAGNEPSRFCSVAVGTIATPWGRDS